jgi:hypothetical protein
MPSLEYKIDELASVSARFLSDVRDELQRALFTEKKERKVTQQAIADKLGVNRSVVNRQFMGLENITVKRAAELLWAIGWEPHFEARKREAADGENEFDANPNRNRLPKVEIRAPKTTGEETRVEMRAL